MTPEASPELRAAAIEKTVIKYPPQLPVSGRAAEIIGAWKRHQLIIVVGSTGSGKTTQLPKIDRKSVV